MYLSASDQQSLRGVLTLLTGDDCGEQEIRERLGHALLGLLRADQFASYVWDAERGSFGARVAINMAPSNLDTYGQWHQHHDPITHPFRQSKVMSRDQNGVAVIDIAFDELVHDCSRFRIKSAKRLIENQNPREVEQRPHHLELGESRRAERQRGGDAEQ